jgi:hypothetical protein
LWHHIKKDNKYLIWNYIHTYLVHLQFEQQRKGDEARARGAFLKGAFGTN